LSTRDNALFLHAQKTKMQTSPVSYLIYWWQDFMSEQISMDLADGVRASWPLGGI
jgi:hypothetical protein